MFLIYLLTLFNSVVSKEFINTYRITVGFAFINSMDLSMLLLFVGGVFFGNRPSHLPTQRTHPMLFVILGFLLLGAVAGSVSAAINLNPAPMVFRHMRDYMAWPVCVFAGYRVIGNPRSAWTFMYILVVGGVITATLFIWHFAQNAESMSYGESINVVRSVSYIASAAGIAALICLYSYASPQVRILPAVIAVPVAVYCVVGQCAPLTRGEWLQILGGMLGLVLLLPKQRRWRALLKGLLFAPILMAALYFAVQLAGEATHKDFAKMMVERVQSMLPTERETSTESKAWDSRLGSSQQEVEIWLQNPLLGQGFASQLAALSRGRMEDTTAYFHNGWSSVLATTGIFGFAGFVCLMGTMLWVGRRLVFDGRDRGFIMMGVVCFSGGIFLVINTLSSMVWTQRVALLFGIIAGMALRLRDIQQTQGVAEPADELIEEPTEVRDPFAYAHG